MAGLTVHKPEALDALPAASIGAIRTWDCELPVKWHHVERKPGVYFTDGMDRLTALCLRNGWKLLDVPSGTPQFYASSDLPDNYGDVGAGSMPTDLDAYARFIFSRYKRCNRRSPVNPTGRVVVSMVEWLNEPRHFFDPCREDRKEPAAKVSGFAQAATLVRVGDVALKAADSRVLSLSPSVGAKDVDDFHALLTAPDGAGGVLADHIDAAALHLYNWEMSLEHLPPMLDEIDRVCKEVGRPSLQLAFTECGVQPEYKTDFTWLDEDQQAKTLQKLAIYLATRRGIAFDFYSWDSEHMGDKLLSMRDKPALSAGLASTARRIGKVVRIDSDGIYRASGKAVRL